MAGTGNPALTQFRVAFGGELGITSAWTDHRITGETLGVGLPNIETESIDPGGFQAEGLPTKISPDGDLNVEYLPEDHYRYLANHMEFGSTPAESPTDVWTQRLSPLESAVTFGDLVIEASRDLARPEVYKRVQATQLAFTLGPRAVLTGAITLLGLRQDAWDEAAEVAVTGTPTAPILRGWPSYAHRNLADGNVFIRLLGAPSGSNITIETKIGNAAAYSGTQVVVAATWTNLLDENGDLIGTEDNPVQIYFPSASLADNDEWRFDRERAVWSPSLPLFSPLNEIFAEVLLDGAAFPIREFSLTSTRPAALREGIGGRWASSILNRGLRTVSGQLNREVEDTELLHRLETAQSFALRVNASGELIASTGIRRRMSLVMMNCKPSGRGASVSNATTYDEAFDFTAHRSTDGTYPAPLVIEMRTSIEDVTA